MKIEELKTPCYIINEDVYRENICELMEAYRLNWPGNLIYGYSVKTNHLPYMIGIAHEYGWKIEVVSPDEYELAGLCGISEMDIIYNGPQKRDTVINAIKAGSIVNLDNLMEVDRICSHAAEFDLQKATVGIRVNFDLEMLCPGETTCKNTVGRFGICLENGDFEYALKKMKAAGIPVKGLHMHSSSSSRSLKIFKSIANVAVKILNDYNLNEIEYIDIGGGFFGGNYFPNKPTVNEYAETICREIVDGIGVDKCKQLTLMLEPGAAILATSMDYLVSVLNIRDIRGERVITVDGSTLHINPMMNPHETPCTLLNPGEDTFIHQVIGGSTCMEMDRIYPRDLKQMIELNTEILFHACGAYMSTHNSSFINAAPFIYVKKNDDYICLRKKTVNSMYQY